MSMPPMYAPKIPNILIKIINIIKIIKYHKVLPCYDESCWYCFPKHPKASRQLMELARVAVTVQSQA